MTQPRRPAAPLTTKCKTLILERRYYSAFSAPNGTFGGWLFSAVPNALFLADQCFAKLYGL